MPSISHTISAISSFKTSFIFSFFFTFSTQESSALKLSLLCIRYTLFAISAKYKASVIAVFQPPTIITFLSLKNIQSQVAQ
jgi:putative flippase GtrA